MFSGLLLLLVLASSSNAITIVPQSSFTVVSPTNRGPGPWRDALVKTPTDDPIQVEIRPFGPDHYDSVWAVRLTSNQLVPDTDTAMSYYLVLPPAPILLLAGATMLFLVSFVMFYRNLNRRNEKRIRFGLLWDGRRQPICGKCNDSLEVLNDYSFQCPSCRVELGAREETGQTISPRDALAKIRLKEYWSSN